MSEPAVGRVVVGHLQAVLGDVLGVRLDHLFVYGSAATGDLLPGYSDLDLLILVRDHVTFEDARRLHFGAQHVAISPFSYIQPTFARSSSATPLLIEGAFLSVLGTEPPPGAMQSEADLRQNGSAWLEKLPDLLRSDAADWALAAGHSQRQARLVLTRLKPAVRALLVREGSSDAVQVWSGTWDAIISLLGEVDDDVAWRTAETVHATRREASADEIGDAALRAISAVIDYVSATPSGGDLIIS